jgi:hypothetical protein
MMLARKVVSAISLAVLLGHLLVAPVFGKDSLTAEEVFHAFKAGVVSISTGATFGSGFLVDDAGLILTTCDVLKDGSKTLRVKFAPEQIVEGKVLIRDQDHNLAVVRVNLKNIRYFKSIPLPTFDQADGTKANDQVVSLALDKKTSEKVMNGTSVRSTEKDTIYLRGKSDPAGYGGPVLNLYGQVIGVCTTVPSMPGQPAAIPISIAASDIEDAKLDAKKLELPSAELLPDVPNVPFNVSELLKNNPDMLKNRKQSDYNFASPFFSVSVFTPVQGYFQLSQLWGKLTGTKKESKEIALNSDDLEISKQFFDTEKPVVTVMVIPRMRQTNGAKFLNAASLIGSTSAIVAGSLVGVPMLAPGIYVKHKVIQRDFIDLSLVAEDGKPVAQPIEANRVPLEKETIALTGFKCPKLEDMAYIGVYSFDARCFDTDKKLSLAVSGEAKDGKEAPQSTVQFPDAVKKRIVEDFKPYWTSTSTVAKTEGAKTEM